MSGRMRKPEWLIALGTVLLAGGGMQTWYRVPHPTVAALQGVAGDARVEGIEPYIFVSMLDLGAIKWVAMITLAIAVYQLSATLFSPTPAPATQATVPLSLMAFILTVMITVRIFSVPFDGGELHGLGIYTALAGALALWGGAYWSMADEYSPPGFVQAPEPEQISLSQLEQ